MEKFFKLKEHSTTTSTEIIAGITTFLSMVYILAVNPNILSAAGMDGAAVFTATAISAIVATLFMAFFANYPVALASGMGLNAYFAFSVCIPMAKAGINDPWKIALAAVLVEGIVFVLLSLTSFREKLVNEVPANLKYGITAGIGLFTVLVGLKSAGIVIGSGATLVELGQVVNILSDVEFFLGTQYQVHPIDSDEVFRLELGIAAYCGYKSIFVVLKRFANNLPELFVCIFRYGTSVNDIDISRFLEIHLVKTFILKTAGNGSRFSKIQLASQGIKSNTFFHKGKRNLGAKIQKNND